MNKVMYILLFILLIPAFLHSQTLPPPDLETAKTLLNQGKKAEAVTMLEILVQEDQTSAVKKYYLARAYSWSDRWDEAIEMYTAAGTLDQDKGEVYFQCKFGIAQVTGWKKKYSQSVFMYAALLDELGKKGTKPFIRDIYIGMGDTSSWNNDYEFAISNYQHALDADPTSAEALSRISKIYFWMHDYRKSKEFAEKALKLDPGLPDAKNRIKDIELIKKYIICAGSTTTLHSAKNIQGSPIRTEEMLMDFSYKPDDDTKLRIFSKVYAQNYIETKRAENSDGIHTDFLAGAGASRKFRSDLYLGFETQYVYNAVIVPDFSAEFNTGYKISRIFDLVALYRLTYDRLDSYQSDVRPVSHILAPGIVSYFDPTLFLKTQAYIDTNFRNYMVSGFADLTYQPGPLDKADLYLSYGKGQTILVFNSTETGVDVVTMGIAGSYTHYFNSTFGLSGGISWTKNSGDTAFGFNIRTEFRL